MGGILWRKATNLVKNWSLLIVLLTAWSLLDVCGVYSVHSLASVYVCLDSVVPVHVYVVYFDGSIVTDNVSVLYHVDNIVTLSMITVDVCVICIACSHC